MLKSDGKRLKEYAENLSVTPAQLAIAWVLRKPFIYSLVGAKNIKQVAENLLALQIEITPMIEKNLKKFFSEEGDPEFQISSRTSI